MDILLRKKLELEAKMQETAELRARALKAVQTAEIELLRLESQIDLLTELTRG